jgi:hypothetical protein
VAFGVIHQPDILSDKVFVNFVQRVPKLAGRHARNMMPALTFENMHDLPDPRDGDLGVFCLAVPDPPAQPFDLLDNEGLRLHPARRVGR